MTQKEKLHSIAENHGLNTQLLHLAEECAEHIQAAHKCVRFPGDQNKIMNLFEELEDVQIMTDQIRHLLPESEVVSPWIREFKINREVERMNRYEKRTYTQDKSADGRMQNSAVQTGEAAKNRPCIII